MADPIQAKNKAQSWAGQPGQFADKHMFQNAIDAINKTGASVKGFADGNKNDLALVQNFYSDPKNTGVLNQYDMSTNFYLRYLTGRGAEGIEIGPERTKQLSSAIEMQKENLKDPMAIENIRRSYGKDTLIESIKGISLFTLQVLKMLLLLSKLQSLVTYREQEILVLR